MPLPIIVVPTFPNVPQLPGVPQIPRAALNTPPNPVSSISGQSSSQQTQLWDSAVTESAWGVFDSNGNQVLFPDSIFALDYSDEWKIPDYQQQEGAFVSYNKVSLPFEISVRMNIGDSLQNRSEFIDALNNIVGDTNLYTIATPEITYLNCNIRRREMLRRGNEGAYFLEVDVFFRQINQVTAQYSISGANTTNAQNPAAQPSTSLGNQQPSNAVPGSASTIAQSALSKAPF